MRLTQLRLPFILFAVTCAWVAACEGPSARPAKVALAQECQFGRERIERLAQGKPVPIVLSSAPLPYEGVLVPETTALETIVPEDLKRSWTSQPRTNLLVACPGLSSMPGIRVASPTDDVETHGASTSVYYLSAPVFDGAYDNALIMEGFYCSGRCGGYAIEHFRRNGTRWERQRPLWSGFG